MGLAGVLTISCTVSVLFCSSLAYYKLLYFLLQHTLFIRVRVLLCSSSDRRPLPKLSIDWEWEEMVWQSSSKEQSLSRQIFISFSSLDNSPVTASSAKKRRKKERVFKNKLINSKTSESKVQLFQNISRHYWSPKITK